MAAQDTEITLGTGKMLALFFGLVALCAVFFGIGFTLGKDSARPSLASDPSVTNPAPGVRSQAAKGSNAANPSDGLTFYKAVEQKEPATTLTKAGSNGNAPIEPAPAQDKASAKTDDQAAPPDPLAPPPAGNYFVQVAAVSKQDDAQALVDALKKKQYSAFATNSSSADKLYHVQIGPFADIKDAEITRGKLISDGYNPILKK